MPSTPKPTKTKSPTPTSKPTLESQIKDLQHQIHLLTVEIETTNSFLRKFLLALVTGLGTVIGATLLIALLVYILSQLATFEVLKPFVQSIVDIVQHSKI